MNHKTRMSAFGAHILHFACVTSMALVTAVAFSAAANAEEDFPFDQQLLYDTQPMPGTKRIPSLEVAANGAAVLDLWCATVRSQLVIAGDTVTVLTGPKTPRPCSDQQERGDAALLSGLEQVTTWRAVSDGIELRGPQTLRFMLSTH